MDNKHPVASNSYIQLNKKITNRDIISEVELEAKKNCLTPTQTCYKLFFEAILYAREKRLKFERMMGENANG